MNLLDQMIGFLSPAAGARRIRARFAMEQMDKYRRYDAAGKGRRFDGWKTGTGSANRETETSLMKLIARSRDLDRNNPYAKRAVERIADNVVGIGIRPTFEGGSSKLRKTWKAWAETTECDFDGRFNIYGLEWLVTRTLAESGGCLVRKRRTAKNKSGIPIQIQVLEPDILDMTKNFDLTDGGYCIQGIEFDATGRRRGYWMYDRYPSDHVGLRTSLESKFVPSDDVNHVYHVERPGQCHGVPFGVQSFLRLKDFDDFEDAELVRQKIAACFTAFITDDSDGVGSTGSTKSTKDVVERFEPGMIEHLPAGKQVSFGNPPIKEGFGDYSRQVLRGIAAGYGVTYEALTGDLSNVNFSSGRMGWLEFQRTISRLQWQVVIPIFCDGVFAWFLEGATVGMVNAKDFTVQWTPPRREMIDPSKEIAALSAEVRNGFKSWEEAVTELGYEPVTVLQSIEKYNKLFDASGIILDSDPRKTAGGGKAQAPPPEEGDGEEPTPAKAAANKKPAK